MPRRPQFWSIYLQIQRRCFNKIVNGDESEEEPYYINYPIMQARYLDGPDRLERKDLFNIASMSMQFRRRDSEPVLNIAPIVGWSRVSEILPYRRCVSAPRLRQHRML